MEYTLLSPPLNTKPHTSKKKNPLTITPNPPNYYSNIQSLGTLPIKPPNIAFICYVCMYMAERDGTGRDAPVLWCFTSMAVCGREGGREGEGVPEEN